MYDQKNLANTAKVEEEGRWIIIHTGYNQSECVIKIGCL
jgi:hydrogenase maturation factor